MRRTLAVLSFAGFFAAIVLFVAFMADSRRLGGDALNGRQTGDRFYVADHGRETEVAADDWRRNRALGIAMLCVFPLGMLGMTYAGLTVAVPRSVFRDATPEEREARAREVVATGPAIATSKAGGGVFGKRMMTADVRPGGLVLRLHWVGRVAVRASEIVSVRRETKFLQRFVVVEHGSAHAKSPLRLLAPTDEAALVAALTTLASPTP